MKDHTQYGEKLIIDSYFQQRTGFFLDIGAADGVTNSNTYHLSQYGWNGILIEPCHHFLDSIKKIYEGQTNIQVFEGAISDFDGETTFYVYETAEDSQISTINLYQKQTIESSGWFKGKFTDEYIVKVLTPQSLFSLMNVPNKIEFVDIDAEGSDMNILRSWPWDRYSVELFCIEHSMGKDVLIEFMKSKNYSIAFSTAGNLFFTKS